ncbi:MAG: LLM class flavin-dependent oxidoreductase [Deltaproteobacteria bacterium]|nr:LLM class flavin-dependent oxidoreductase [Deltaproteobacteria bacterium]
MKIRIGITLGQWPSNDIQPEAILELLDSFEALDLDSLWVSDRLVSSAFSLEPITFLSYIAGRLRRMKFGTSTLVLSTRNPVILGKELATLDFISQGRFFPAVGLGSDDAKDFAAVGVNRKERAQRSDEAIVLMRRLWTEENVSFQGKFFSLQDVTITPRPWQRGGPPIWIGGRSEPALRRTGRLGDGWLVSGVSTAEVADGIKAIRGFAAEAGRVVPEDHYGVLLPFHFARSAVEAYEAGKKSLRQRPELSPFEFTAFGTPEQVRQRIQQYIAAGATKFVMRPCGPFEKWREQTEILAREVIEPLQTPD